MLPVLPESPSGCLLEMDQLIEPGSQGTLHCAAVLTVRLCRLYTAMVFRVEQCCDALQCSVIEVSEVSHQCHITPGQQCKPKKTIALGPTSMLFLLLDTTSLALQIVYCLRLPNK